MPLGVNGLGLRILHIFRADHRRIAACSTLKSRGLWHRAGHDLADDHRIQDVQWVSAGGHLADGIHHLELATASPSRL